MRRWLLTFGAILPVLGMTTCAKPRPTLVLTIDSSEPRYFTLPDNARDADFLCDLADQIATCASVSEVKTFLHTARVGP
jgi:hypothetical protein